MRVETVMEGGRRIMAPWKKEEVNAAMTSPGEEISNKTGKVVNVHGSVEPCSDTSCQ